MTNEDKLIAESIIFWSIIGLIAILIAGYIHHYGYSKMKKKHVEAIKSIAEKSGFVQTHAISHCVSISTETFEIITASHDSPMSLNSISYLSVETDHHSREMAASYDLTINFTDGSTHYIDTDSFSDFMNAFGILCAATGRNLTSEKTETSGSFLGNTAKSLDKTFRL